jgi:hypothetical protein
MLSDCDKPWLTIVFSFTQSMKDSTFGTAKQHQISATPVTITWQSVSASTGDVLTLRCVADYIGLAKRNLDNGYLLGAYPRICPSLLQ